MRPHVVHPGDRFGRLIVLAELEPRRRPNQTTRRMLCRCDCGVEKDVPLTGLKTGTTKSCGCLAREKWIAARTKHGDSKAKAPEYLIYGAMIARCENPNNADFKDYGERGITVCARWRSSYADFLSDMGRRPTPRHSIDRIDNDRGYEPDNCRWATAHEQRMNQRRMRKAA